MAKGFDIVGRLQLQVGNVRPAVDALSRQLGGVNATINASVNPAAVRGVAAATNNFQALQSQIGGVANAAVQMNKEFRSSGLQASVGQINRLRANLRSASEAADFLKQATAGANSEMFKFGQQAALSGRRFLAFSIGAVSFVRLAGSIRSAANEALEFQRNMVRLGQLGAVSSQEIRQVSDTIGELSKNLGVSSRELADVSIYLKGAGLSVKEVNQALEALAKTSLAPTFKDLRSTTEGLLSLRQQFSISGKEFESVLGSINNVAREFAAESEDIIEAVRRAGAAFRAASGDLKSPTDSLNEFISLFTSVRQTTRESAESIATSFRTIFARLQSNQVSKNLKDMGINLRYTAEEARVLGQNVEGQFIGAFNAVGRISQALKGVATTDPRFSSVIQEIGGVRQVSKVIPLIQQYSTAQKALSAAQAGTTSLTRDADKAQEAFTIRLSKLREEFLGLVREVSQSKWVGKMIDVFTTLATSVTKLVRALEPLLPLLVGIAAVKIGFGAAQFARGFVSPPRVLGRRYAQGGFVVPGSGHTDSFHTQLPERSFVIRKTVAKRLPTDMVRELIGSRQKSTGRLVNVALMPGEVVVPPDVVERHYHRLQLLNKGRNGFATGGLIPKVTRINASVGMQSVTQSHRQNPFSEFFKHRFDSGGLVSRKRQYSGPVMNLMRDAYRIPRNTNSIPGFLRMLRGPHADTIASHVPANSQLLGAGTDAVAYKTPEGKVVRIGGIGKNKQRREEFLKTGRPTDSLTLQPDVSERVGHYTVETLPYAPDLHKSMPGNRGRRNRIVRAFAKRLLSQGKIPHDVNPSNLGMMGNKIVAIDPETYRSPSSQEELEFHMAKWGVGGHALTGKYASGGLVGGKRREALQRELMSRFGHGIDFTQFADLRLAPVGSGAAGKFVPHGSTGPEVHIPENKLKGWVLAHEFAHAADYAMGRDKSYRALRDRKLPYASAIPGHPFNKVAQAAIAPIYSQITKPQAYQKQAEAAGVDPTKLHHAEAFASAMQAYAVRKKHLDSGGVYEDLPAYLRSPESEKVFSMIDTHVLPRLANVTRTSPTNPMGMSAMQLVALRRSNQRDESTKAVNEQAGFDVGQLVTPQLTEKDKKELKLRRQETRQARMGRVQERLQQRVLDLQAQATRKVLDASKKKYREMTPEETAKLQRQMMATQSRLGRFLSPAVSPTETETDSETLEYGPSSEPGYLKSGKFLFPEHLKDNPKHVAHYGAIVPPLLDYMGGPSRSAIEHAMRSVPELSHLAPPGPPDEKPHPNPFSVLNFESKNFHELDTLKASRRALSHGILLNDVTDETGASVTPDFGTNKYNPDDIVTGRDVTSYQAVENAQHAKVLQRINDLSGQGVSHKSILSRLRKEGLISAEQAKSVKLTPEVSTQKKVDIRANQKVMDLPSVQHFMASYYPQSQLVPGGKIPKRVTELASAAKKAVNTGAYSHENVKVDEQFHRAKLAAVSDIAGLHGYTLTDPHVEDGISSARVQRIQPTTPQVAPELSLREQMIERKGLRNPPVPYPPPPDDEKFPIGPPSGLKPVNEPPPVKPEYRTARNEYVKKHGAKPPIMWYNELHGSYNLVTPDFRDGLDGAPFPKGQGGPTKEQVRQYALEKYGAHPQEFSNFSDYNEARYKHQTGLSLKEIRENRQKREAEQVTPISNSHVEREERNTPRRLEQAVAMKKFRKWQQSKDPDYADKLMSARMREEERTRVSSFTTPQVTNEPLKLTYQPAPPVRNRRAEAEALAAGITLPSSGDIHALSGFVPTNPQVASQPTNLSDIPFRRNTPDRLALAAKVREQRREARNPEIVFAATHPLLSDAERRNPNINHNATQQAREVRKLDEAVTPQVTSTPTSQAATEAEFAQATKGKRPSPPTNPQVATPTAGAGRGTPPGGGKPPAPPSGGDTPPNDPMVAVLKQILDAIKKGNKGKVTTKTATDQGDSTGKSKDKKKKKKNSYPWRAPQDIEEADVPTPLARYSVNEGHSVPSNIGPLPVYKVPDQTIRVADDEELARQPFNKYGRPGHLGINPDELPRPGDIPLSINTPVSIVPRQPARVNVRVPLKPQAASTDNIDLAALAGKAGYVPNFDIGPTKLEADPEEIHRRAIDKHLQQVVNPNAPRKTVAQIEAEAKREAEDEALSKLASSTPRHPRRTAVAPNINEDHIPDEYKVKRISTLKRGHFANEQFADLLERGAKKFGEGYSGNLLDEPLDEVVSKDTGGYDLTTSQPRTKKVRRSLRDVVLRRQKAQSYEQLTEGLTAQAQANLNEQLEAHGEDVLQRVQAGHAQVIRSHTGNVARIVNTTPKKKNFFNADKLPLLKRLRGTGATVPTVSPLTDDEEFQFSLAAAQADDPSKVNAARDAIIQQRGGMRAGKPKRRFGKLGAGLGRVATFGLGVGAVAAQFAPEIINSVTGDIGIANTKEQNNRAKIGRGLGGAIQYGSTGALLGSAFGTVGTALGAAAGALYGFISATKEADKELRGLHLGRALEQGDTAIEGVLSGKTQITPDVISSVRASLGTFDKSEYQENEQSRSPSERISNRQKYVQEHIAPRLGQYRAFNEALARDVKITDPNLLRTTDESGNKLSEQQLAANRAARIEQFKKAGGAEVAAKVVEATPGLTYDKYYEGMDKLIVEQNLEAIQHKKLTAAIAKQEIETQKFLRITSAIDVTVASMKDLQSGLDSLDAAFENQVRAIPVHSHVAAAENFGGLDTESFNKAVDYVGGNLRGANSAQNDLIDSFSSTAKGVNKAAGILPDVISSSAQGGPLSGEGIVQKIASNLSGQGLDESITKRIVGVLDGMKPEEIAKAASENVQKLSDTLIKEGFANVNETLTNAAKALEERANNYNQGLVRNQEMINKIGESQDKYASLQVRAAQTQARVRAEIAGRPGQADIDIATQLDPIQQRQERLTGLAGADANNPQLIGAKLRNTQAAIDAASKQVRGASGGRESEDAALRNLTSLQGAAQRLGQALEHLTDPVERNAALQEKLNRLEEDRNAKLSFEERLQSADPRELMQIQRNAMSANAAIGQGHLYGLRPDQRRGAIEHLRSLGEAEVPEYGGAKASDVLRNLLRNSAVIGGRIRPQDERQRIGLMGQMAENDKTAADAQAEIVRNQESLQAKFFTDLGNMQSEFFAKLSVSLAEAQKRDITAQQGENRGKLTKSQAASDSVAFLAQKQLTVEQARAIHGENLGEISELQFQRKDVGPRFNRVAQAIREGSGVFGNNNSPQANLDALSSQLNVRPEEISAHVVPELSKRIEESRGKGIPIDDKVIRGHLADIIQTPYANLRGGQLGGQIDARTGEIARKVFGEGGEAEGRLKVTEAARVFPEFSKAVENTKDFQPTNGSVAETIRTQHHADLERNISLQKESEKTTAVLQQTQKARSITPVSAPAPRPTAPLDPTIPTTVSRVAAIRQDKAAIAAAQQPGGNVNVGVLALANQLSRQGMYKRASYLRNRVQLGTANADLLKVTPKVAAKGPTGLSQLPQDIQDKIQASDKISEQKRSGILASIPRQPRKPETIDVGQYRRIKDTGEIVGRKVSNRPGAPYVPVGGKDIQQYSRAEILQFQQQGGVGPNAYIQQRQRSVNNANELYAQGKTRAARRIMQNVARNDKRQGYNPQQQNPTQPTEQQRKTDPAAAMGQNIQSLGGVATALDKTVSNMGTTLSNVAGIFKDLKIPEKIEVGIGGRAEVIFNGAQLMSSMKGEIAEYVGQQVMAQLKEQLPNLIKNMPPTA